MVHDLIKNQIDHDAIMKKDLDEDSCKKSLFSIEELGNTY